MQRLTILARRLRGFLRRPWKTVSRLAAKAKPLVLVIESVYPQTDQNSGALSIVSHMRVFNDLGYRVVFVARDQLRESTPYREKLEALGIDRVGPERAASIDKLLEWEGATFSIFFLSRVHVGGTFYEKARSVGPSARIIFNLGDLHHLRSGRRVQLTGDQSRNAEIARTKARELELVRKADASIALKSS